MMIGKSLLFGQDEGEAGIMRFVSHKMRELRWDERRLAEQRITKHQFRAKKSCIADARSYRLARRLPVLAVAQFHGRTIHSPKAVQDAL